MHSRSSSPFFSSSPDWPWPRSPCSWSPACTRASAEHSCPLNCLLT
ncbi:hypothetical protein ACFFX0_11415 [Citricoccus parietis]|uniref:Uncharacterized protein n=1 Tax=Citricoccus parietis TaxID=592307 RepID=A0ABV5FYL1_9MICC